MSPYLWTSAVVSSLSLVCGSFLYKHCQKNSWDIPLGDRWRVLPPAGQKASVGPPLIPEPGPLHQTCWRTSGPAGGQLDLVEDNLSCWRTASQFTEVEGCPVLTCGLLDAGGDVGGRLFIAMVTTVELEPRMVVLSPLRSGGFSAGGLLWAGVDPGSALGNLSSNRDRKTRRRVQETAILERTPRGQMDNQIHSLASTLNSIILL